MNNTMKKPHWSIWVLVIALCANLGITLWNARRTPRLAYVRSQDLVYGYFGMKEAMSEFQGKQGAWKANVDSLRSDLQRTMVRAHDLDIKGDKAALRNIEQVIGKQRQDLMRYQDAMDKKSKSEEQKMLSGVLDQVNAFVEAYAKKNGYDVVLGTTDAGSLLYGQAGMDITADLLVALNKDHEGLAK